MYRKFRLIILSLCLLLLAQAAAFAQEPKDTPNQKNEWIRVQSDNGEFSIEVPANSNYFFDKEGFQTSYESNDYSMQNASLLNSYYDKTLLSFEAYEAKKNALKSFIEIDKQRGSYSKFSLNGNSIEQVITKTDKFYSIRWYFFSKKFVYILTGASKSETPVIKKFLDSLIFKPDTKEAVDAKIPKFSSLKVTPVHFENLESQKDSDKQTSPNPQAVNKDEENLEKLVIVNKPPAFYVIAARMNRVQGKIRLRVEFSSNGTVSKIEVLKSLPEGLMRQTVFAALRIKFLPEEEYGKPKNVSKVIEYSFTIY